MNPIVDDLPKVTPEEAYLATKMVYDKVPLKDAHTVLQMLGLEPTDPVIKSCPTCGFRMTKSNGKTWRCSRCSSGKRRNHAVDV